MGLSGETEALFQALRQSADAEVVGAIAGLVEASPDRELNRINALDFAALRGLDAERTIAAFLHAARLGIFELSWNVLCPGCGGVFDVGATLKTVDRLEYQCALCAADYQPTLDEMVEVTFTVSPRIRRIAAHDPHALSFAEYYRQVFWSSGVDLPDDAGFERLIQNVVLDFVELPAGEKAVLSLRLPPGFFIVFDPVTHTAQFVDVAGEPTDERRNLSLFLDGIRAPTETLQMPPGPVRIAIENRIGTRTLPGVWIAGDELHALLGRRKPFVTANRLLTNQTFRNIYRTETLDINQRLKITSLTFLFTDLKGSTALYDRVGDLVAFELVRAHFDILNEIVDAEAGAIVKTIGDAVMATFPTPDRAVAAALRMRDAIQKLNAELLIKIGIHEGPCLAVMLNERQDYFGQTVNIAARVQSLAVSRSIFASRQVVGNAEASKLLQARGITPMQRDYLLRGIANELAVYEIP
jgi:class 3 adenylate cyclase